jgi:hypothetical protein
MDENDILEAFGAVCIGIGLGLLLLAALERWWGG